MTNDEIKNNKVYRIDYSFYSWACPRKKDNHILYMSENTESIDINAIKSIIGISKETFYKYLTCKELTEYEVLVEKLNGYEISNMF